MKILVVTVCFAAAVVLGSAHKSYPGESCTNEGKNTAAPYSCKNYLLCQNKKYVLQTCGIFKQFDRSKNICRWSPFGSCQYKCSFKGKKPVSDSSTKYTYCYGGRVILGDCQGEFADGYFNPKKNQCEPPSHSCNKGDMQINPTNCHMYFECVDNAYVSRECIFGNYFDLKEKKCQNKHTNCKIAVTTSTTTSVSTEAASIKAATTKDASSQTAPIVVASSKAATTKDASSQTAPIVVASSKAASSNTAGSASSTLTIATTFPVPQCTKEGEKRVDPKGSCNEYEECDTGKWKRKSCSFPLVFDTNDHACTLSWSAVCYL